MTDALRLVEVTIKLPETTALRYFAMAARRETTASAVITELVMRAAENLLIPKSARSSRLSPRPRATLSVSDGIAMLSMHFAGAGTAKIASDFNMTAADVEQHLQELTSPSTNPRRKRQPRAEEASWVA